MFALTFTENELLLAIFGLLICCASYLLILRLEIVNNHRMKAIRLTYGLKQEMSTEVFEQACENILRHPTFLAMVFNPIKWSFSDFYPDLLNTIVCCNLQKELNEKPICYSDRKEAGPN